ncbi:Rhodopirellula transposase family protein OS=Oscillatoria nigro-viridis PCC 7112 GN=Osc7112_2341 PE=4 SV=1: DDE_Tnp_ISAZ013 [Gemmata obscuriglobus UQM 2246]|nr:Rhodopirellula transposase family protein OS=Oscillatoria nigro-viridis PCC 7112 GN=Osc7112_2341 PE=4 SV=1: DDE_Tnp_ISAZ013 [Gemmata obscuriglobus UQM 2246]
MVFHTVEAVRHYMAKSETTTGLRIFVGRLNKAYATGRKCVTGFKKAMKIVFDPVLPKWNYTALPDPP